MDVYMGDFLIFLIMVTLRVSTLEFSWQTNCCRTRILDMIIVQFDQFGICSRMEIKLVIFISLQIMIFT